MTDEQFQELVTLIRMIAMDEVANGGLSPPSVKDGLRKAHYALVSQSFPEINCDAFVKCPHPGTCVHRGMCHP